MAPPATVNVYADSLEGFSCHVRVGFESAANFVANLTRLTMAQADVGLQPPRPGAWRRTRGLACPEHPGKMKSSKREARWLVLMTAPIAPGGIYQNGTKG
jgi:hypothetical protein